jgi:SAM-dependent methyltransferase
MGLVHFGNLGECLDRFDATATGTFLMKTWHGYVTSALVYGRRKEQSLRSYPGGLFALGDSCALARLFFGPYGDAMPIPDIRRAFEAAAEHYAYRLPYRPDFFRQLGQELGLSGNERVLDLCCGSGQVAFGLAPAAGSVSGVDFSAAMLASAPTGPNLTYHLASAEEWAAKDVLEPYDVVTIGHAVHWIAPETLGQILSHQLRPGGKVVILGNQWDGATPWLPLLRRLESKYQDFEVSDVDGRLKLGASGFTPRSVCRHRFGINCDLEYLRRHVMSYARFARKISECPESFKVDLSQSLGPRLDSRGLLGGIALNWALIFTRT